MTILEERLAILKMIENGKITAAEGAELLKAIGQGADKPESFGIKSPPDLPNIPTPPDPPLPPHSEARWLRVTVTDPKTGQQRVKLNIPIGLVNTGLRMGARFVPNLNQTEYKEIMEKMEELSRSRQSGQVVNTVTDSGEHVSVYIE